VIAEGMRRHDAGPSSSTSSASRNRGAPPDSEVTRIEWSYPVCRNCGCTEYGACDTVFEPCAWLRTFDEQHRHLHRRLTSHVLAVRGFFERSGVTQLPPRRRLARRHKGARIGRIDR
jgi:hypothetical protein